MHIFVREAFVYRLTVARFGFAGAIARSIRSGQPVLCRPEDAESLREIRREVLQQGPRPVRRPAGLQHRPDGRLCRDRVRDAKTAGELQRIGVYIRLRLDDPLLLGHLRSRLPGAVEPGPAAGRHGILPGDQLFYCSGVSVFSRRLRRVFRGSEGIQRGSKVDRRSEQRCPHSGSTVKLTWQQT